MTEAAPPAKIDIGRVIGRTFAVTGANFGRFFAYSFVLSTIPVTITGLVLTVLLLRPFVDISNLSLLPLYTRLNVTLSEIPGYAGFGAVTLGAVTWLNANRAGFWTCARRGVTAFPALLVMHAVVLVGLAVGLLLLIVPAAFLATILIATGPVIVIERAGLLDALRRSAYLTLGNRWWIFLLIVIAAIVDYALGMLTGFLARSVVAMLGGSNPMWPGLALAGFGLVSGTITYMFTAAGLAALYNELRTLKEGPPEGALARVFD